jgi:hypothetical protein
MPHDCNGKVLAVGDEVTFKATITAITPNENFCNCTVKAELPKVEGVDNMTEECITTNSKFFEKLGGSFGDAIKALKAGHKVARTGWNGKGMWLVYMSGMTLPPFNTQGTARKVNDRTAKWIGEDTPLETLPYIAMWTADKKWLPGWLASQTDILADDWTIVD